MNGCPIESNEACAVETKSGTLISSSYETLMIRFASTLSAAIPVVGLCERVVQDATLTSRNRRDKFRGSYSGNRFFVNDGSHI